MFLKRKYFSRVMNQRSFLATGLFGGAAAAQDISLQDIVIVDPTGEYSNRYPEGRPAPPPAPMPRPVLAPAPAPKPTTAPLPTSPSGFDELAREMHSYKINTTGPGVETTVEYIISENDDPQGQIEVARVMAHRSISQFCHPSRVFTHRGSAQLDPAAVATYFVMNGGKKIPAFMRIPDVVRKTSLDEKLRVGRMLADVYIEAATSSTAAAFMNTPIEDAVYFNSLQKHPITGWYRLPGEFINKDQINFWPRHGHLFYGEHDKIDDNWGGCRIRDALK